jgi:transcriptional antiterminator NusG
MDAPEEMNLDQEPLEIESEEEKPSSVDDFGAPLGKNPFLEDLKRAAARTRKVKLQPVSDPILPELPSEESAELEVQQSQKTTIYSPEPGSEEKLELTPEEGEKAWYVIHCYSGYENKVRHNLEQRIETMGMKDKIFDVVIPTQEEIEVKDGKRRVVERHVFPGYVLVYMSLSEESWYVVRNTPGVTGFVGMGIQPTALRPEEVQQILRRMEAETPHIKVSFRVGERVRIVDGPFNDFRGTVSEIDMDRTKVRVMVNFFGRETPVELDFLQVEKS